MPGGYAQRFGKLISCVGEFAVPSPSHVPVRSNEHDTTLV
jgi:hypothetical protein